MSDETEIDTWDPEHKQRYKEKIQALNRMSLEEFERVLREGKCPYPVEEMVGVPLGMFHCDICGTMVVAGVPHGKLDPPWGPTKSVMARSFYDTHPHLDPRKKDASGITPDSGDQGQT